MPESVDVPAVLGVAGDFVAEVLDKEKGAEVTDYNIFRQHAAKYEKEFMEDMTSLGVRMPDVLTRVSEYIPEVVSYIERIVSNGMAYSSQGSAYFDTIKFRSSGHTYGKLKPWAVGAASLAGEGEANFETREKKCPQDFALWKASKPGEPSWPSPWGQGRPGWHIECSAMASAVLGSRMDIHSGGEDLRFPHHDNELAQAEAHYHHEGCQQWVNYFLHSGHLEIEGLKMSKSLKNFITIREALQTFTPRQMRLLFALQPWNKPMTYGEQSRILPPTAQAAKLELISFFDACHQSLPSSQPQKLSHPIAQAAELELSSRLLSSQQGVHAALCDNINTAAAMDALSDIVKATNIYLAKQEEAKRPVQPLVLERCSSYVTKILSVFGIVDPAHDRPGLRESGADGHASTSGSGQNAAILDAFAAFRDEARAVGVV
ncbi:tRNA synthetases class I (C) catalytic domain-containing protein [Dunaliella salina]|uniref:tRNA synthetases class I (C) catalytic domain-containing protein n=1 Tax=Dunaliella salina TaxID=3046 RepID=A0ABQ7G298_DUNSA|nr:tRNA synthetases class I (C) catalytic domain-containing protein [Dunaliella salina]|eukprot:KAF5828717.1 tRNA synthetases class I (C) catalytic domain-containing protein [Dunaliella salina]